MQKVMALKKPDKKLQISSVPSQYSALLFAFDLFAVRLNPLQVTFSCNINNPFNDCFHSPLLTVNSFDKFKATQMYQFAVLWSRGGLSRLRCVFTFSERIAFQLKNTLAPIWPNAISLLNVFRKQQAFHL